MNVTAQLHQLFPEISQEVYTPDNEKKDFIADLAATVFDSAVIALMQHVSVEDRERVMQILNTDKEISEISKILMTEFAAFESLVLEEIMLFREETVTFFGGLEADTGIPATT